MTFPPERTAGVGQLPRPVQIARVLLVVVAVSHLVVPLLMWLNRSDLQDQISADHPEFGSAELAESVDIALRSAAFFHAPLLALCALLVWRLPTGRPWTWRLTIISQLLSILFGVISWSSSPMFHWLIPIISSLQIVLVGLLVIPAPAKAFFARGIPTTA